MEALKIKNIKSNGTLIIEANKKLKTWEAIQLLENEGQYWKLEILIPNFNNENGIYLVQFKDPRARVRLERKLSELQKEHQIPSTNEQTKTIQQGKLNKERTTKRIATLIPRNKTESDIFNEYGKYGRIEYIKIIPARRPGYKVGLVKFSFLEHHNRAMKEAIFKHREGREENNWKMRELLFHERCGYLVAKGMINNHRKYCKIQSVKCTKWDEKPEYNFEEEDNDKDEDEMKLIIDEDWDVYKEIDALENMVSVKY